MVVESACLGIGISRFEGAAGAGRVRLIAAIVVRYGALPLFVYDPIAVSNLSTAMRIALHFRFSLPKCDIPRNYRRILQDSVARMLGRVVVEASCCHG